MTEDEIVGQHHLLGGHEFEHTPGDSEGQGNLACLGLQRVEQNLETEHQQQINIYCVGIYG